MENNENADLIKTVQPAPDFWKTKLRNIKNLCLKNFHLSQWTQPSQIQLSRNCVSERQVFSEIDINMTETNVKDDESNVYFDAVSMADSLNALDKIMLDQHKFKSIEVVLEKDFQQYFTLFQSFNSPSKEKSLDRFEVESSSSVSSFNFFQYDASCDQLKNNIYEVEKVLGSRKSHRRNKMEYFLKWKSFPYNVSSWEVNISECNELLGDYRKRKRVLDLIADELKNTEKPFYKMRCTMPSFFVFQRWEDDLAKVSMANGQGPIFVENWVDSNCKLRSFKFITENEITNEARALFKEPKEMMYCKCSSNNCGSSKGCCPDIFGMKFPYTSTGRVRNTFDMMNQWLVECADNCACGPDCPTRVVQRGRKVPIVIFRTLDRGWSVRTMAFIPSNTFVMEYIGLVITLDTAKKSLTATYQFEMDACLNSAFVVDALNYGNEARFVNHSCEPNMVVRGVFCERYDNRYHRIAYFAARDINKGEEITINYFSKFSNDEFNKLTKKRNKKSCFCNAPKCRGHIV